MFLIVGVLNNKKVVVFRVVLVHKKKRKNQDDFLSFCSGYVKRLANKTR